MHNTDYCPFADEPLFVYGDFCFSTNLFDITFEWENDLKIDLECSYKNLLLLCESFNFDPQQINLSFSF